MGKFLVFSDENRTLVAMVRNLENNFVSPQFHVVFDEKFSTIQSYTRLEDTEVEAIFNDLFTYCRNFYVKEVRPPEETISAPEGYVVYPSPQLGGQCLTEAEICDKDTCTEDFQAQQHTILQNQAKEFEKLNDVLQPIWTLNCDDVPSDALTNDDDRSV